MPANTRYTPPTFRTIDGAVVEYYKNMNLMVDSNEGTIQVPVTWAGAERSFQIKHDQELRDSNGALVLPQITVRRTNMEKSMSPNKKGSYHAIMFPEKDVKGGSLNWSKRISKTKTSEFSKDTSIRKTGKLNFKIKSKKPEDDTVYEFLSLPTPVYYWMTYEVVIRAEYQIHLNQLLTGIMAKVGNSKYFLVNQDGWRFECFYEDNMGMETNSDDFNDNERMFKHKITFNCLGYIFGGDINEDQPKRVIRENAVRVSIQESIYGEPDNSGSSTPAESDLSGGFSRGFSRGFS